MSSSPSSSVSPPRLLAVTATGPILLELAFDVAVVSAPESVFELRALGAPAVTPKVVSVAVAGNNLRLMLDTELSPGVSYELYASGVTDVAGNAVAAPFQQANFVGFRPATPSARRFQLWEMLPRHNRRDDATGDLARCIACLQEVTDLLLADVDRWPDIFDLERAPEPFLDLILEDLGNPFSFELDAHSKRRLASVLVEMYRQKGTAQGIKNAVRFFLGIELLEIREFNAETLVLGASSLDDDWVLGPSKRFDRYAFDVVVGRVLAPAERKQFRAIVEYLKPAHTHFVALLEPGPPPGPDHWVLEVSLLGETTQLH